MGYLYLAVAIAGELVGTAFLKYSDGYSKPVPTLISIASYALCFYIFSKSLQSINLSVAYATWSAVGLIVTTLISVFIFREGITGIGVGSILLITIGVVLLNLYGTPAA